MRYAEQQIQPAPGKEKEEAPREMAKPGSYSMEDLQGGKKLPMKGGNSFGSS